MIYDLAKSGTLDPDLARDICAVLNPSIRRSPRLSQWGSLVHVLRGLVSGELDVDRDDYLLRDSHYCGVRYGIFDLKRLLACLTTVPGERGPELALDGDGIHAFEGLLLARYHMFLQVYFHKTLQPLSISSPRLWGAVRLIFPLKRALMTWLRPAMNSFGIVSMRRQKQAASGVDVSLSANRRN